MLVLCASSVNDPFHVSTAVAMYKNKLAKCASSPCIFPSLFCGFQHFSPSLSNFPDSCSPDTWYETLSSMLSAEKEQIKVLQNNTNIGQVLNTFLLCQKYQGQDNATAPYDGGCFNPFLLENKMRPFASNPTALAFGESTGIPHVEATSNEGGNTAEQTQVPPPQGGMCWGYITLVLKLPPWEALLPWISRGLEDTRRGWRVGLLCPGRPKPNIHRNIPCSLQTP